MFRDTSKYTYNTVGCNIKIRIKNAKITKRIRRNGKFKNWFLAIPDIIIECNKKRRILYRLC